MGDLIQNTSDVFEKSSEKEPFEDLVVVKPTHFQIKYQINPYMNTEVKVDSSMAMEQWTTMKNILSSHYNIHTVDPDKLYSKYDIKTPPEEIPDFVFSANHWTPLGSDKSDGVLLSNFANSERKPETEYMKYFLEERQIEYEQISDNFEGQGDFIWEDNHNILWAGHGIRTDYEAVEKAVKYTDDDVLVVPLKLETNEHYHLDTCFKSLSPDTALIVEEAFEEESYQRLEAAFENLIKVPPTDFSCNSLVLDKKEVLLSESSVAWKNIEENGFSTRRIKFSEFMKSGGSIACSVGPINL